MNPRQYKATISLNKAINKFLEEGYYVFTNVCEQGPIDIVVVNPANGRARYFDVKTSRGTRIVNGKAVGGSGNKLKPDLKTALAAEISRGKAAGYYEKKEKQSGKGIDSLSLEEVDNLLKQMRKEVIIEHKDMRIEPKTVQGNDKPKQSDKQIS